MILGLGRGELTIEGFEMCRILGNQQLFLVGLKLTSPLFTAVVQNMVPVITFLVAALMGYWLLQSSLQLPE